jgi:23S rRNA pseudouridine2457 synthase
MANPKLQRFSYILFNKPYGVLSQFTDAEGRTTLNTFGPFPHDVYAAGRLDADSEGLLLLTNDNQLNRRITEPGFGHPRTYLVQVERIPTEDALRRLRNGIILQGRRTQPAEVRLLKLEPDLPERAVPIRFRKNTPTAWLEVTLQEGRNRQVRRMTAAVGHPTLRLVRIRIGSLSIDGLAPGKWRHVHPAELNALKNS